MPDWTMDMRVSMASGGMMYVARLIAEMKMGARKQLTWAVGR